MNQNDKIPLKAEVATIDGMVGAVSGYVAAAKGAAGVPQAAIPQICSALEIQQQVIQKISKLLDRMIDKS